jgi:hypothetical protein
MPREVAPGDGAMILHVLAFGPRDCFISTDVVAARFDRLPAKWIPSSPSDIVFWDGMATGVDAAGNAFAVSRGYSTERRPYLSELGKAGGPARNRNVANELAAMVALGHRAIGLGWQWPYLTPGTKSMAGELERVGIPYRMSVVEKAKVRS